jgi:hypothetical protein
MKAIITAAAFAAALAVTGAASAQMAPAAPAPAAGALTTDTPIETIVADPAGKAVLDKDAPGLTTHPMYEQFKSMSLKELAPMSQGKIDDAALAKINADLAAAKK